MQHRRQKVFNRRVSHLCKEAWHSNIQRWK